MDFIEKHKEEKENITSNWNSIKTQKELNKLLKVTKSKTRDPNKPKRGKSSYIIFCDAYRPKLKSEFPDANNKEILTKLGKMWDNIKKDNPNEYKKFESLSLIERNRYKEQMEEYKNTTNENFTLSNESKPKESKPKESKPKEDERFLRFYEKKHKKLLKHDPEIDIETITKKISKKWNSLSEEEKNDY